MAKYMTMKEFKNAYAGAPIDDIELAERCADELKPCDLQQAAKDFLEAQEYFYDVLDAVGFERG